MISISLSESYGGNAALKESEDSPFRRLKSNSTSTLNYRRAGGTDSIFGDSHSKNAPSRVQRPKTVNPTRKFSGILLEMEASQAKVLLEEAGRAFEYYIPSSFLIKFGIRVPNQPFEMHEFSIEEDDRVGLTYKFIPLARPEEMKRETLDIASDIDQLIRDRSRRAQV